MKSPTLISMPLAFMTGIIVSLVTRDEVAEAKFEEQRVRSYLGAAVD